MSETPRNREWGSKRACSSFLGVNPVTFTKMVSLGAVTVRRLPGATPQYLWSDVERLARESVTPARAS